MSTYYVAVEIDTYQDSTSSILTRYISTSGPLSRSGTTQYDPRITALPSNLGMSISSENYGQATRVAANGGIIEFSVDPTIWSWFSTDFHWIGRTVRVYEGFSATGSVADLSLMLTLRVANLVLDDTSCQIQTTDASYDMDNPLVTNLYDATALPQLVGLPIPQLWGTAFNLEPILEDDANQIYRVSSTALGAVSAVRVGGVAWTEVSGAPGAGQWSANLSAGTIQLGSQTLGGEVRCDAQSPDAATLNTSELITQIVTQAGGTANSAAMATLAIDFPALVGYYTTTTPVNTLDVLDDITSGSGLAWGMAQDGTVWSAIIATPDLSAAYTLDKTSISSVQVTQVIPPVWRMRVQYARNWSPNTNFFSSVSSQDQALLSAPGLTIEDDNSVKIIEPRAIDLPVMNSLVLNETDAITIIGRLSGAWYQVRNLYDVKAFVAPGPGPQIYDTAGLVYQLFSVNARVHSFTRAFGAGAPSEFILWG